MSPKGVPSKKEEVTEIPKDRETVLLEELAKLKAEKAHLEEVVKEKEVKEAKETDPLSGPGALCEAYEISRGEAWQPKIIGETKDHMIIFEKCPEGYTEKKVGENIYFTQNGKLMPNCKSKFTKEYTRKYRQTGKSYANFEYDKIPVNLCEHHAHTLLGKESFAE